MLDHVKPRNDIKARPWRPLDNVSMHGSDLARSLRQFRVRLNPICFERFSRDPQKVTSRASNLQQFSRRLQLSNQLQSPFRIEQSEPMFFFQPQMSKPGVSRSYSCRGCLCRFPSKRESGSPSADISKSALHTLDERSIQMIRIQNEARTLRAAKITGNVRCGHDAYTFGRSKTGRRHP